MPGWDRTRTQQWVQMGSLMRSRVATIESIGSTSDLCKGISEGGFFMAWDDKAQAQTARALPVAELKPKTGDDEFNGALNLTPGHVAQGTQVAAAEQAKQDGQGIRAAQHSPR